MPTFIPMPEGRPTILALDIATRTGTAFGPAGQAPVMGALRLKAPAESLRMAPLRLGEHLRNVIRVSKPDLIAYEEPLDPAAIAGKARVQSSGSMTLPWMLVGVIEFICGIYAIDVRSVPRATVLKHFTGRGRWANRQEGKSEVLKRAILLKLLPADCRDDDMADAVALHDYASSAWCRVAPKELVLFGEEPRRQSA